MAAKKDPKVYKKLLQFLHWYKTTVLFIVKSKITRKQFFGEVVNVQGLYKMWHTGSTYEQYRIVYQQYLRTDEEVDMKNRDTKLYSVIMEQLVKYKAAIINKWPKTYSQYSARCHAYTVQELFKCYLKGYPLFFVQSTFYKLPH